VFGIHFTPTGKARQQADNWLEAADRVYHFRRDVLTAAQVQEVTTHRDDLRRLMKAKAGGPELRQAIERLEPVLRAHGGKIYPQSTLVEYVEFFLVAAIVILGLRAYFVQPFKIPTNSMWPSYYGMTSEVHSPGAEPGIAARAGRLVAFGAWNYTVKAPADGEIYLPFEENSGLFTVTKPGRSMLILAAMKREYYFRVGTQDVSVTLPAEFNFWDVIERRFEITPEKIMRQARGNAAAIQTSTISVPGQGKPHRVVWIPIGRTARTGEAILSFDILTGDMLFVDRLTYNFVKPRIGQGFVFRTDNIKHREMESPAGSGRQRKEYYIKRLVGGPGDVLEVKAPAVWRNGAPIAGSDAFAANNTQAGDYRGYSSGGYLSRGLQYQVPNHHYFAMGDNSGNSADSRVWGSIPEKDVVGKPLFIYYPFTRRWGAPN